MDLTIVPDEALGTVTGVSNIGDLVDTPTGRIESGGQALKAAWNQVRNPVRFQYDLYQARQASIAEGLEKADELMAQEYANQHGFYLDPIPGEYALEYDMRYQRRIHNDLVNSRINDEYTISNFVAGLPAETGDVFNFIPFGLAAKVARKTKKVADRIDRINDTQAAINMGQRFKSVLYGQKDFLKYAVAEAPIAQGFYDHAARDLGYETDPLTSIYGIGMNIAIGQLTFGTLSGFMHYKAADANLKKGQTFKEIYSFFETGEFGKAASIAYTHSPQFQKAVKEADALSDFVQEAIDTDGIIRFAEMTPTQTSLLKDMLKSHMEQGLQTSLNTALTRQVVLDKEKDKQLENLPIPEQSKNYQDMYMNVLTAIRRGNFKGLTDKELKIAKETIGDTDGHFVQKNEEDIEEIIPTHSLEAQLKSDEYASVISDLMRKYNTTSVDKLVELNVLTRQQANKFIKRFAKQYKKAYAYEIAVASQVVESIFGTQFTFKQTSTDSIAYGYFDPAGDRQTVHLNRMEFLVGEKMSPFSVIFHEVVHAIERIDPTGYADLNAVIEKHPLLKQQLDDMTASRGGYMEGIETTQERASALMEWAITTPEFWAELKKSNIKLFDKLRLSIARVIADVTKKYAKGNRQKYINTELLAEKLLTTKNPGQLAAEIGNIINESKVRIGNNPTVGNTIARHKANVSRLTQQDYAGPTGDDIISTYIRDNQMSVDAAKTEILKARVQGLKDDLAQLLPPEQIEGDRLDNLILAMLTRRDSSNLDVDPDATELISYDEYKATIKEILYAFDEETGNTVHVLAESELKELYNIIKDYYRDETVGATGSLPNPDIRRRIYNGEAKSAVLASYYQGRLIDVLRNSSKKRKILLELEGMKNDKQKLSWLRSFLDGRDRSARTGLAGIEHNMIADGQQAIVPLMDVLLKHNLIDLFLPEQGLAFFKTFKNVGSKDSWKMFGKRRKEQSRVFFQQLHEGLLNREIPENWKGIEGLEELFNIIQATEMKILFDMNRAGLRLDILDDFGGLSQRWDPDIIYTMGFDRFYEYMNRFIDKQATMERMSGVLIKEGKQEQPWTFDEFMKMWYESLDPNRADADNTMLMDLDRAFGSRNIVVKREFASEAATTFSGYESIGHLMLAQIQRRAALASLAETAGTKPGTMLKSLVDDIGGKGTTKTSQKYLYLKTVDKLTGLLDNPVDATMGSFTNKAMRFSNIMFLSGSGASSLTDIPNAISTLDVLGIPFEKYHDVFLRSYAQGVKNRFTGNKPGMQAYYYKLGAAFDVLNNAVASRITDLGPTAGGGFLNKLHQLVFKINGLNALTTASEEMFVDVLTRFISDAINEPGSVFVQNLERFGFTAKEILELTYTIKTPDGATRMNIDALSPKTRKKFDRFVTKYIRQGVFRPDIGTQVLTSLGFRAGTPEGSAMRILTQYQSFMLGMTQNIFYRMKNGISSDRNTDDVMMYKMAHFMAFAAGSIAMAYMATVLKDLAKGKEPINIARMSSFQWNRIINQSGLLGVLELPMSALRFDDPTEVMSPLPQTILGFMYEVGTGDATGAYKKVQDLTGENIYGPPQWFHQMTGTYVLEYLNEFEQWLLDDSQR